jgi:hypothetical protein
MLHIDQERVPCPFCDGGRISEKTCHICKGSNMLYSARLVAELLRLLSGLLDGRLPAHAQEAGWYVHEGEIAGVREQAKRGAG